MSGQAPVSYTYDHNARLRTITQAPLNPVDLQYDAANRRTLLTLPNGVSTEYQYDLASRLAALIYRNALGPLGDLTYQYDAAGNRIATGGSYARTLVPEAITSGTYDAGNRQLTFGAQTLTYDDNGNRLTQTDPSGTIIYTWDARNRLTAMTGPSLAASFVYDGLGRRAQKTIGSTTTAFRYDGLDAVRESSGGSDVGYLRTQSIDESLVRTDAAGTVHYLGDALGSAVALTNPAGTAATTYTFEPFGRTEVSGTPNANPFQFTGREDDGTGLYYYRARYYDPTRSRFVSEDPIRLAGGDKNLYAYVRNAPSSLIDPSGLLAGWLIKLTKSGFQRLAPLAEKAAAVEARKAGDNVLAETRQMAKAIERANAGGAAVERHAGHDLADGSKGMSHYQTPGKPGHTFWLGLLLGIDSMLASLLDPLDAISGELDSDIEDAYLRSVLGGCK